MKRIVLAVFLVALIATSSFSVALAKPGVAQVETKVQVLTKL